MVRREGILGGVRFPAQPAITTFNLFSRAKTRRPQADTALIAISRCRFLPPCVTVGWFEVEWGAVVKERSFVRVLVYPCFRKQLNRYTRTQSGCMTW